MERSKVKDLMIVLEGFAVLHAVQFAGGYYLAPFLLRIFPSLPVVIAGTIASSDISPLVASLYMVARVRTRPRIIVGPSFFSGVGGGIVLIWLIFFLSSIWFDKTNAEAKEILTLPSPYVYVSVFLKVVWGPLWEEVLVRGCFFELLNSKHGSLYSTLISTFLFVISHGIWGGLGVELVVIALYSLVFTLVYTQSGILGASVTHMFVNAYLLYLNAIS